MVRKYHLFSEILREKCSKKISSESAGGAIDDGTTQNDHFNSIIEMDLKTHATRRARQSSGIGENAAS